MGDRALMACLASAAPQTMLIARNPAVADCWLFRYDGKFGLTNVKAIVHIGMRRPSSVVGDLALWRASPTQTKKFISANRDRVFSNKPFSGRLLAF